MRFKLALTSLVAGVCVYFALWLVSIGSCFFWFGVLLTKTQTANAADEKIIRDFGSFLKNDKQVSFAIKDAAASADIRVSENRSSDIGETSASIKGISAFEGEVGHYLEDSSDRFYLEKVRACLGGETNELILGLLLSNRPQETPSEDDVKIGQQIMNSIRSHPVEFIEDFQLGLRSMENQNQCASEHQLMLEVYSSVYGPKK